MTDEELLLLYGKTVMIGRKKVGEREFVLVHLDSPARKVMRARAKGFDPETYFDKECGVCRWQMERGVIVFDERGYEEGEG